MQIPLVQSDEARAGAYVDLTTHLFEKRTLFIGPQLTSQLAISVGMQIMALAQQQGEISIFLNCHGGHVPSGLAVVDMLDYAKKRNVPIYTVCLGECIGVATVILAAGTRRAAFRSSRVSLYQEWYGMESIYGATSQDENERSRLIDLVAERLVEYCPGVRVLSEKEAVFDPDEWDDFTKTHGVAGMDHVIKAQGGKIRLPLDKVRVEGTTPVEPSDGVVMLSAEAFQVVQDRSASGKLRGYMGRLEFLDPKDCLQIGLIQSVI